MKKTDGDYLWDRTGEPDPEIQQLEQVLGTLRYQPRPLDIPAGLAPLHKRALFPGLLAIAATIAIMLLGVGLWLSLHRRTTGGSEVATKPVTTNAGDQTAVVAPTQDNSPVTPLSTINPDAIPIRLAVNRGVHSREMARSRRPRLNTSELTAKERKEAEAAKEQLMLALRVASAKLNFAQKKAQEINSDNLIHNQHKIG